MKKLLNDSKVGLDLITKFDEKKQDWAEVNLGHLIMESQIASTITLASFQLFPSNEHS